MLSGKHKYHFSPLLWLTIVILLGITLRMCMPLRGFNYDIESWKIAADILSNGGNVYGQTGRYNYGPIWFYVLHFLDQLPLTGAGHFLAFRWKVAIFLTVVDVAIFTVLLRLYGLIVASLFFLNPISIVITGYHSQMDNFALLLGFLAVLLIQYQRKSFGLLPGLALLGVSLVTKHFLIFFPLWLAFKEVRWSRKILVIAVPYTIFLISFLPYLRDGSQGILHNVFLYRSVSNAPFWNVFAPNFLLMMVPPIILFLGTLMTLGIIWQKKTVLESFNYYLICVVIFSSAVMNQYFSIALPAIASQWNWGYSLFTAFTTLYLSVDWAGLHFGAIQNALGWQGKYGYNIAIALLFIGFIIHVAGPKRYRHALEKLQTFFSQAKKVFVDQIKSPW